MVWAFVSAVANQNCRPSVQPADSASASSWFSPIVFDRDRQFRLLARRRSRFQREGWPIISIDCKKKELIGNFKNPGKTWRRDARGVLDHDFPSWADGRAIPFGVYDIARNHGLMVVGISRETSAFVVNAIRTW